MGIGKNNSLPWPYDNNDLKWFREMTIHKTIIMGRKTWESLPIKSLPNRKNIVITSNNKIDDCITMFIDNPPFKFIKKLREIDDVWIISGSKLIKTLIREIDEFYVSRIEGLWIVIHFYIVI
jgi:dihydrofolate reductase